MENIENNFTEEAIVSPVVEEAPVVEAAPVEEATVEPVKVEEVEQVVDPVIEEQKVDAIVAPSYNAVAEEQALGSVENGVIGATTTPKAPKKQAEPKQAKNTKTVAIKSTKNVVWSGVGKVVKGINIVSENEAEKWSTRSHITIVKPEDVAKEFGK